MLSTELSLTLFQSGKLYSLSYTTVKKAIFLIFPMLPVNLVIRWLSYCLFVRETTETQPPPAAVLLYMQYHEVHSNKRKCLTRYIGSHVLGTDATASKKASLL